MITDVVFNVQMIAVLRWRNHKNFITLLLAQQICLWDVRTSHPELREPVGDLICLF